MSCSKNIVAIRQLTSASEKKAGAVVRLAGGGWMLDSEVNLQDYRNVWPDYGPDV